MNYIGIVILALVCYKYFKYCDKMDILEQEKEQEKK